MESEIVFFHTLHGFMGVHVVIMGIDDARRNVGAVVGSTLYIGQKLSSDKNCLTHYTGEAINLEQLLWVYG